MYFDHLSAAEGELYAYELDIDQAVREERMTLTAAKTHKRYARRFIQYCRGDFKPGTEAK